MYPRKVPRRPESGVNAISDKPVNVRLHIVNAQDPTLFRFGLPLIRPLINNNGIYRVHQHDYNADQSGFPKPHLNSIKIAQIRCKSPWTTALTSHL